MQHIWMKNKYVCGIVQRKEMCHEYKILILVHEYRMQTRWYGRDEIRKWREGKQT